MDFIEETAYLIVHGSIEQALRARQYLFQPAVYFRAQGGALFAFQGIAQAVVQFQRCVVGCHCAGPVFLLFCGLRLLERGIDLR